MPCSVSSPFPTERGPSRGGKSGRDTHLGGKNNATWFCLSQRLLLPAPPTWDICLLRAVLLSESWGTGVEPLGTSPDLICTAVHIGARRLPGFPREAQGCLRAAVSVGLKRGCLCFPDGVGVASTACLRGWFTGTRPEQLTLTFLPSGPRSPFRTMTLAGALVASRCWGSRWGHIGCVLRQQPPAWAWVFKLVQPL